MRFDSKINKIVAKFGLEDERTKAFLELCEMACFGPAAWEAIDNFFEDLMEIDIFTEE